FFFQAEDGIRYRNVTGVQTCALPIYTDSEEKLNKLYVMVGNKPVEVPELHAGDIGAIAKLNAKTGDSLATKAVPVMYGKPEISEIGRASCRESVKYGMGRGLRGSARI